MAHPTFYPTSFFYPLGNTAPVSLTEHVPPGADADFLLLGCGDPRNILYTIYASGLDTTAGEYSAAFAGPACSGAMATPRASQI